MKFQYQCSQCGQTYEISPDLMVCPDCSKEQNPLEPLRGVLDVALEGTISKDFDILNLLPVPEEFFPPIPVGRTPMWLPETLNTQLGLRNLYIKNDALNPTGSLKDRASYLVSAFARQHKIDHIVLASTGNAGSSMAGIGVASGIQVTLFLPKDAPTAKLVQALQYGADVRRVDGNYDKAYELSLAYSAETGALNRNTAYNPLTIEGKKTVSLEIVRQLHQVPDYLFVPVGDGVIISGVYKGFNDLLKLGVIEKIPTVYGVQAVGSNAIYRALPSGIFGPPESSQTIADSIAVDVPKNGYHACRQIKDNHGKMIQVSDAEIIQAQKRLATQTGIFAEPAASAAFAGLIQVHKEIPTDATIVVLVTGTGLKDISAAMKGVEIPEKLYG